MGKSRRRERAQLRMRMDTGARKWMLKFIHQNFWRVAAWYDFPDLVQDGLLKWHVVVTRYSYVKNRSHMMSLFQTAFKNHIHQLCRTKMAEVQAEVMDPADMAHLDLRCEDADMASCIMQAPTRVRAVLKAVTEHPERLTNADTDPPRVKGRRPIPKPRQTTDEWLSRIAEFPETSRGIRNELRAYLKAP